MFNTTYKFPAISVIIPMYNVEKYVGQCLGSLLSQTFQDFEVIVVDDCSTDNSVKIVESIAPKFNGRLQLIKRKQNAGAAAIPRNIGMSLSRGKYLFFLDSDDIIVNNAFEILYDAAEQTNADVVHVEKYFVPIGTEDIINEKTKFRLDTIQSPPFVDKITIETEDIYERMKKFHQRKYSWWACSKLFLRKFLIENRINFVDVFLAEDMIFILFCLFCSKIYVRIPNNIYIYRQTPNSIMRKNDEPRKYIHNWFNSFYSGLSAIYKFFNNNDSFKDNLYLKQIAVDSFSNELIGGYISKIYSQYNIHQMEKILNEEIFSKYGEDSSLVSYIFNMMNIYRLKLTQAQQQIFILQKKVQEKN